MKRIAIFCGSKMGNDPKYAASTKELISALVSQGIEIVYGGGDVGLMGIVAETALENGGTITGVIPDKLYEMEVAHTGITKLYRVKDMHERKALMADLSDAFIALPGGVGTLEEMTEVMTWAQIGYHSKPCAFLNTNGYYDHFIAFFDHMEAEGFLYKSLHDQAIVEEDSFTLVKSLFKK
ncbi:TIGR00730 family Rossman fold protein [Ekhidna sp. To15]|uniref:LOG family protein n=1 Tax=Ekhidna sp. To15 TaxID=3395267 RepID=UPI003F51E62A